MQLTLSVIFGLVSLFAFIKIYTGHPKLSKLRRKNITDKPVEEGSVDEYKKEYFKVSSDVSYVKSQWDNYIINSLKSDLETFKEWSKRNPCKDDSNNKFWTVIDIKSDKFRIMKCGGDRWSSIKLWIDYKFDESNFSIKIEKVETSDVKLKITKELTDVITKYISIVKINDKIRENNRSLISFNEMVNILGKRNG
jgi:hypothetical protein